MKCAAQFHLFYLEPVALLRHPLPSLSLVFRLLETHQNAITAKETRQGGAPHGEAQSSKAPSGAPAVFQSIPNRCVFNPPCLYDDDDGAVVQKFSLHLEKKTKML